MIVAKSNIIMTGSEVVRFRNELHRRLNGDLTEEEKARISERNRIYTTVLTNNGGKNPLFS